MGKFFQGYYQPVNKAKYIGTKMPVFRSSWEHTVMIMFDNNPNIISWASEPLKIPYRNPFTGRQTVYVQISWLHMLQQTVCKRLNL